MSVQSAMQHAMNAEEPLLGRLDLGHAQICPQNPGKITPEDAQALRLEYPGVQFRLHANAQVAGWSAHADASTFGEFEGYFHVLWRVSESLGAPAYTWHAGMRRNASLQAVLDRTDYLEQAWGIDVGIEGLYPTPDDRYLLSTWDEYRVLLDSGVKYALDMSHINILAHRSGERNAGLVRNMLSSPACIEVHLSGNAGDADTHGQLATEPWWWDLLDSANPNAVIFTEGGQTRPTYF
jgi:hypothetical protein